MASPVPDDTRGIVDPAAMLRLVQFARYPAGDELAGLVDWLWSVSWALPPGAVHHQQVLNHPAGHISIGTLDDAGVPLDPPQGRVYGVLQGISERRLTATGWTVAARTSVGGLGALLGRSARWAANRQLTLAEAIPGLEAPAVVGGVSALDANPERVDLLRSALAELVARRDPALVAEAREVAAVADLVERDRTLCRIEQLASVAGGQRPLAAAPLRPPRRSQPVVRHTPLAHHRSRRGGPPCRRARRPLAGVGPGRGRARLCRPGPPGP